MTRVEHQQKPRTVLVVRFTIDMPLAEYRTLCAQVADAVAAQPGLRHKLWLLDPVRSRGGGVYIFESLAAAKAYLNGPIIEQLSAARIRDLSAELFEMLDGPARATSAAALVVSAVEDRQ